MCPCVPTPILEPFFEGALGHLGQLGGILGHFHGGKWAVIANRTAHEKPPV